MQYGIYQTKELKKKLKKIKPDLLVVVAFRKLPDEVWKLPPLGTINLHASLLPQYRGAAPINWVLINGEKTTGVTTFFIDDKIVDLKEVKLLELNMNNNKFQFRNITP